MVSVRLVWSEVCGSGRTIDLNNSTFVDGSQSSPLVPADDQVSVPVPCDLERIVRIFRVYLAAERIPIPWFCTP